MNTWGEYYVLSKSGGKNGHIVHWRPIPFLIEKVRCQNSCLSLQDLIEKARKADLFEGHCEAVWILARIHFVSHLCVDSKTLR